MAEPTQHWSGPKGPSAWPSRPLAACPICQRPTAGAPFCPRDGALTAAAPFLVGGRYLVDERIGTGGTALVFGARHEQRAVALKVLRPELAADAAEAQRFLRAARIASGLAHEHIGAVFDFGHDAALDLRYLAMERLRGQTLAEIVRASAPLPWARATRILVPLARALVHAHAAGVVHRDLKPANVILAQAPGCDESAKLCDFGLSRSAEGHDRVTATGAFVGTPAYMAPEQIRGDATQDARVDLYALGVTAYELVTGELPHRGATPVALIAGRLIDDVPPLHASHPGLALPPAFAALVARCLERDPERRPSSAQVIVDELVSLLADPGPSAEPAAPLDGADDLTGRRVGSYRLTALLGRGGAGSVYRAEHPVIGATVAVKLLSPEVAALPGIVDRFAQEARAASEIGSPHIPRYIDFGRLADGRPYVVMECLEGETLAQRMSREGPLPVAASARILAQVADAMAAAHAAGIVHRDLKPENLFLVAGAEEHVKVLDFGIAKVRLPEGAASQTQTGVVLGTPCYSAPEQLMGEEVGPAADVYALGATAFEMLTGRLPFAVEGTALLAAKVSGEAPSARGLRAELPSRVDEMLRRMLARAPEARPAPMSAVRDEILAWSTATTPRRSRWALGAAVVIAAALAWAATLRHSPATTPTIATAPAVARAITPPAEARPVAPAIPAPAVETPPATPSPTPSVVASQPRTRPARTRAHARPAQEAPSPRPPARSTDVIIVDPFHP